MTTERAKATVLGGFRQVAARIGPIRLCRDARKARHFSLLSPSRLPNQDVPPIGTIDDMSQRPPAPPSLQELRKEIDAIDEGMHRLLMQRGDIIDRLIQVKQTQEVGSAFRPAREASMMRRLVERHRGILPIDTVESIWRVIISTFT